MAKKKTKSKKKVSNQTWWIVIAIIALGILAWLVFDQTMLFIGLLLGYLLGKKW